MTLFDQFNQNKTLRVTLPPPDDSIFFFETVKKESEKLWKQATPDDRVYGFQFQQHAAWQPGLTEKELEAFETSIGFTFPGALRNFYSVMNGLTKPGINVYGNSGKAPAFRSVFYSYPHDLPLIKTQMDWAYDSNSITKENIDAKKVSRIIPVFSHRFMLIDIPGNPILSIHGNDIIYYADNLSKLLATEIFSGVLSNGTDFKSNYYISEIKVWLDE